MEGNKSTRTKSLKIQGLRKLIISNPGGAKKRLCILSLHIELSSHNVSVNEF